MHSKSILHLSRLLTISVLSLVLIGCWGNGDGPSGVPDARPPPPLALVGTLVNAPVLGAEFETPTQSGLTEAGGQFPYLTGENVTFTIGTIFLGTVQAADIITPVELTGSAVPTAAAATNMLVFLQSIDSDSPNYGNGISISAATRAAAEGLTLDFNSPNFDMEVAAVVAVIAPGNAVVSEQTALDNFYLTYVDLGGFTTFGWPYPGYPPFPPPRDSIEDGGFEPPGVPDASGGNQGDCAPGDLGAWSTFNCNFVTSTLGPSSAPVSHDEGGTQSLIQYGVDAGAENVIEALEGDFVELSAWAMSWEPDPFNNLVIMQLTFWDAPGGRLGGGNQIGAAIETFADSLGNQPYTLLPQDGAESSDWTRMSVSGDAPAGTQSAQVLLIHVLIDGTPETGAIYWDDVSLFSLASGDQDFQLIWSDEFDDWCGDGTCSPDPNNWTIEEGYGPNEDGWGNNEWQLYTKDLDNVRVENGNLVIDALCGSPPEGYIQDFEGVDALDPLALGASGAGFVYFTDVWDGDVGSVFKYPYSGSAPNGGDAFSAVASGEGGLAQGDQYLNIYTDYANPDQNNGFNINSNVFQESTIEASDLGSTWTLTFDAKSPFENGIADRNLTGGTPTLNSTTATAFIKTLDPNAGFATTNDIRVDMTEISNTEWATFSINLDLTDPLLEGQLIQFGFNTIATEYDNTGVYYDNISFTKDSVDTSECVGEDAVRDGSITSARINTLETFNTIRYGKIEARIKPAVGKGAWPAFWMLGSNFPDVGWPNSGEIDIMEMFNSFGSNERTTHSTLHWCDQTIQAPAECSFPEGRVFEGDDLSFPESLGDGFHIFEVVWDPEKLVFYADGLEVYSRNIEPDTMEEFTRDFFMILNVAMGGFLGSNDQPPDGTEAWPQTMLVDWVRVYQAVP